MEYKHFGKALLALSVLSVLIATVDYLNLMEAPLGLGANSWMLVGVVLAVYAVAAKQWKSS